jgi:hypothetical protein
MDYWDTYIVTEMNIKAVTNIEIIHHNIIPN